jgi:hypothetical protein
MTLCSGSGCVACIETVVEATDIAPELGMTARVEAGLLGCCGSTLLWREHEATGDQRTSSLPSAASVPVKSQDKGLRLDRMGVGRTS